MNPLRRILPFVPAAFVVSTASAVTLTLNPVADTYVRTDQPNNTFGNVTEFFVGQLTSTQAMHALLSFDLSSVPEDATINSVSLVLRQSSEDAGSNTTITLTLHAVTQTFVASQATWNNAASGTPWTTAGGTFDSTVLSSTNVRVRPSQTPVIALPVDQTWASSASFVTAVQGAADGSNSIGFLLKDANETNTGRELIKFFSKEGSFAPQLNIDYTVAAIPEPSTAAALAGAAVLAGVALRRRRSV